MLAPVVGERMLAAPQALAGLAAAAQGALMALRVQMERLILAAVVVVREQF